MQVETFSMFGAQSPEDINEFLSVIGERVHAVTSFYNTVLGSVEHVVTYWAYIK